MSILVDDREGSGHLAGPLAEHGLDVVVTRMECADVAFVGLGPGGDPRPVGIEIKQADELLSMIVNGRYTGNQLPCLKDTYPTVILAVTEAFYPGRGGELLIQGRKPDGWRREWKYRDLDHWLMTQQFKAGVHVLRSRNQAELLQQLHDAYTWWTVEGWDGHDSHLGLFAPLEGTIIKPTFERRIAFQLPGIGMELSAKVADWFKSGRGMANAAVETWAMIPKIGKTKAEAIVRAWKGRE